MTVPEVVPAVWNYPEPLIGSHVATFGPHGGIVLQETDDSVVLAGENNERA
jgi:hypothetical protein